MFLNSSRSLFQVQIYLPLSIINKCISKHYAGSKVSDRCPLGYLLDLHLSISNDIVSTNIYDKRDDFDYEIVNFPILNGDVPRSTSHGVYISQLIRFARASSYITDFNTRNKLLTLITPHSFEVKKNTPKLIFKLFIRSCSPYKLVLFKI